MKEWWVNEWVSESMMSEWWVNNWVSEGKMNEWVMSDWVSEWVRERATEWVSKFVSILVCIEILSNIVHSYITTVSIFYVLFDTFILSIFFSANIIIIFFLVVWVKILRRCQKLSCIAPVILFYLFFLLLLLIIKALPPYVSVLCVIQWVKVSICLCCIFRN